MELDLQAVGQARVNARLALEEAIRGLLAETYAGSLTRPHLKRARSRAEIARRVIVVGAGKATAAMAQAVEEEWADLPLEGCVSVKDGHSLALSRLQCVEAPHPVPDARSLEAGARMLGLCRSASEEDLVVGLLSGGASSLMESLKPGYNLHDLLHLTQVRLKDGSSIRELNEARKAISDLKAGGLARAASPAPCLVFVLSDVIGNPLGTIGSGPFFEPDPALASAEHVIIGDCDLALEGMTRHLRAAGFSVGPVWPRFEEDMERLCDWFERVRAHLKPGEAAVLSGEPTHVVPGKGLGGRCQEAAMRVAHTIRGTPDWVFAAFGTDGTDGPTDAAGAIVDGGSEQTAEQAGVGYQECLANSDSHRWVGAAGATLFTAPTHTNLNDLYVMVRL